MEDVWNLPSQAENPESDNEIYNEVSLIVQTTNRCSKNCPNCYVSKNPEGKKEDLDQGRYEECLTKLKEGDTIALRGGEITIVRNWFEKFVVPAINKGLKIIIETNGYFIGTKDYLSILEKMKSDNISVRISFDSEHLKNLRDGDIAGEFEKMARFARDAESAGINFGFYSLGMDKERILRFLSGTPLESFVGKFHPLTFHSQMSAVELKGQYLKSNGKVSDRIEE